MELVFNFFLTICWIVASLTEGVRDGHFFHDRNTSNNPDKQNIHWLFTLERFIIWTLIVKAHWLTSASYYHSSILSTGIFSFSLILIFSFFHNSMYYHTRHKLDKNVYPKGWLDTSTTSEAFIELDLRARVFLAAVGILGIITTLLFI